MKKKIVRISVVIGIIIFCFILYKIGPLKIWENIQKITWQNLLILMFIRLLYWLLRTINWKLVINQYDEDISLLELFRIRISGHSISQLTPSAHLGAEAARIMMVKSSSRRINLASVIVDKTIEYITSVFFAFIALAMLISKVPRTGRFKTHFIGVLVLALVLLLLFVYRQKKGLFQWIIDLLKKIRITFRFLDKNAEKIRETDQYISDFYSAHRSVFLKVFLLYSLLILLWTTEIHLTLVFIGAKNITYLDSFIITTIGSIAFAFPLIPASLGVYEVTYISLFALLRQGTDIGFTLVLIRRIIALIWAGLGLIGILHLSPRREKAKEQIGD
jgi:uncharacterized protein (TIRG00374 family)